MSRVDNVTQGELADLVARIRRLEMATPLSNTSVGRGRLRMYDGSELLIEDGNLTISGVATVDGQLVGTGTFTWTGMVNLDGPVVIDGATTINGATDLKGNMTVSGGGKITVGQMVIDPLASSGGGVGGFSAPTAIGFSTPTVVVNDLVAFGELTVDGMQTKVATANVHVDANGKLWRI